jgi:hypothetical protein
VNRQLACLAPHGLDRQCLKEFDCAMRRPAPVEYTNRIDAASS